MIPSSATSAFAALAELVETEIDRETPDMVIFGPIEHAVCHLLYAASRVRGISNHGFQPCYVAGSFVLNSQGSDWEMALRLSPVDSKELSSPPVSMRSVERPLSARWSLWARGAESAIRLALGDNGWDTVGTLSANAMARIARLRWFPGLPRIPATGSSGDFVLITLHQPCLPWASSNWEDLIEFCLEAVPEQYALVVRPHPTEAPRQIGEACRAKLLSRRVVISDPGMAPALSDLIAGCKAVFTLTSATGFQALLRGKMVFTLAPAFYCRSGLARQVSREDPECFYAWLAEGAPGPDQAMVVAFDHWLRRSCLLPYPTSAADAASAVIRRLFGADHG